MLFLDHVVHCLTSYFYAFRPKESDLNRFGINWAAVWVKMTSSWVCVAIYLWTLIMPRLCFGRDLAFTPATADLQADGEESDNNDGGGGDADVEARRRLSPRPRNTSFSSTPATPTTPTPLPRSIHNVRGSRESLGVSKNMRASRESMGNKNSRPQSAAGGARGRSPSPTKRHSQSAV
jgi:hypothetical protein